MKYALKLQATVGDITDFDCTGGEPQDQHRTVAEFDPCPEDVMSMMDGTLGEFLTIYDLDTDAKLGDVLNQIFYNALPDIKVPLIGGEFRLQVRKMDSDEKV